MYGAHGEVAKAPPSIGAHSLMRRGA